MRKVIKILGKALAWCLVVLLMLPLAVALLLNVEAVQNFAVQKAVGLISRKLETTVAIDHIRLSAFSRLDIDRLYIADDRGDTLIYADRLGARLGRVALLRRELLLHDVALERGKIYLYTARDGEMNLSRLLARLSSDTTKESRPMPLAFRKVRITDSRFKLQTEGADTVTPRQVNYQNLVFDRLNIAARRLDIADGDIRLSIDSMSLEDISGFRIRRLSADTLLVGDGIIGLDNALLRSEDSELHMPRFRLEGTSWASWAYFTDSVRFDARVTGSRLTTATLSYFVPSFRSSRMTIDDADIDFNGTIDRFTTSIACTADNGRTDLALHGTVARIIDLPQASFDLRIDRFASDGRSLRRIANGWLQQPLAEQPSLMLQRAGHIQLDGSLSGTLERFRTRLGLNTDIGSVTVAGTGGNSAKRGLLFNGSVSAREVNAGRLLANKQLGRISADVKAIGRIKGERINADVTLFVPTAEFDGHTYRQLRVAANYHGKQLQAQLSSGDPQLLFTATGSANLSGSIPSYDLYLNLSLADLYGLNLFRKDSLATLSGRLQLQGSGSSLENANGELLLSDLVYRSHAHSLRTDSVQLICRSNASERYLTLNSDFADVRYRSGVAYKEVLDYLSHILYDYLPALAKEETQTTAHHHAEQGNTLQIRRPANAGVATLNIGAPTRAAVSPQLNLAQPAELHLRIKEGANRLAAIFLNDFDIASGAYLDASFDPKSELFAVDADIYYVEYGNFFITKLGLDANNRSGAVRIDLSTEDLYLPNISTPSNNISARIADNRIDLSARLSNAESELNALLELESRLERRNDSLSVSARFKPTSYITTGARRWDLSSEAIVYSPADIAINRFQLASGAQSLTLDGTYGDTKSDTLRLSLNDFNLSLLNNILKLPAQTIGGTLDGRAELIAGRKSPVLIANVLMDSLRLNGYTAPQLQLRSAWDLTNQRAGLSLRNTATQQTLIRGFYSPTRDLLSVSVNIDGIPLNALSPFLPAETIRSIDGSTSLQAELRREQDSTQLTGTIAVTDLETTVGITNTTYRAEALTIAVADGNITLPPTELLDQEGNRATLQARARFSRRDHLTYAIRLVPSNLLALNTTLQDNPQYYGKIYVSGAIDVTGTRKGIEIDAAINTRPNSTFYLPLSNKSSVAESDWIVFTQPAEETAQDMLSLKKSQYSQKQAQQTARKSDLNLNVALNINPGLLLSISDQGTDMTLNARGSAVLNIMMNPTTGELSTFGTYTVSEGDFIFSLPPLISNKRFTLQPGGTIQLNGNPMAALLNIEAEYRLRASLQPLAASFEGTGINTSTRIPVDCIVRISESLEHPDLLFDIRIPSADTDVQSVLSSALSSNELRAFNFIWLVGFGSFMPSEDANTQESATSAGAALGLDFLTNQLSNLLSTKDLQFNFGYRPENTTSSEEFDFGLTYNIGGNDRLILELEGNYNADNTSSFNANNSNFSGDASLTWLLTNNLSLKAFTRTITRYDENQGLQENGVGVYYKEDFNVFSDIRRQWLYRRETRRKRREERREERAARRQQATAAEAATETTLPKAEE